MSQFPQSVEGNIGSPAGFVNRIIALRDGLYKIVYSADAQPVVAPDEALAVVRRGRIFASDRHGGVYRGVDAASHANGCSLTIAADVPPRGELVTGFSGGRNGATAAIEAVLDPTAQVQRAVIHIEGAPLEIDITYLGQLTMLPRRRSSRP
jgi:hypothetical protein